MNESNRQRKLSRLVQKELSAVLQQDVRPPAGVLVTISVVRSTADLSISKVYISALPIEKRAEIVDWLIDHSFEIRKALASRIRYNVKNIPELQFFEDDTLDEVEKMESLFSKLDIKSSDQEEE